MDNESHTTESVYFINSTDANVTTYADLNLDSVVQCFFSIEMKISQNDTSSAIKVKIVEVQDNLSGLPWTTTCFPNSNVHLILEADTGLNEEAMDFMQKTSHLSFLMTTLAIIATFFTIAELKAVSRSLEQRELVGQTENHAKRLSIISNCMICIWNMCYSITYFVTAMYFRVSLRFK